MPNKLLQKFKSALYRLAPRRRFGVISISALAVLLLAGILLTTQPALASGILDTVSEVTAWLNFTVSRFFLSLALFLLTFIIQIAGYNRYIDSVAVQVGWVMIRDLVNMAFVIFLLVIAFGTILGLEQYEWKKLMVKFVVAAVLVNFSRVICGIMIDVAQVFMTTFVNGIAATAGGNLLTAFSADKLYKIDPNTAGQDINATETLVASIAALMFAGMMMMTMLAIGVMLLMRLVMLWVLVVMSPLAFALNVIPKTEKYAQEWWQEFGNNLVAGPVLIFFVWLALVTVGGGDVAQEMKLNVSDEANPAKSGISEIMEWENMTSFAIAIGMLLMGAKVTQQFGAAGGDMVSKAKDFGKKMLMIGGGVATGMWMYGASKKIAGGAAKGLGKGALWLGRYDTMKNAVMKQIVGTKAWGLDTGYRPKRVALHKVGEEKKDADGNVIGEWKEDDEGFYSQPKVIKTAVHKKGERKLDKYGNEVKGGWKEDDEGFYEEKVEMEKKEVKLPWLQGMVNRRMMASVESAKKLKKVENFTKVREELMDKRVTAVPKYALMSRGEDFDALDRMEQGMLEGEKERSQAKTKQWSAVGKAMVLGNERLKFKGGKRDETQGKYGTVMNQKAAHLAEGAATEDMLKARERIATEEFYKTGKGTKSKGESAEKAKERGKEVLAIKAKAQLQLKAAESEVKTLEGQAAQTTLTTLQGRELQKRIAEAEARKHAAETDVKRVEEEEKLEFEKTGAGHEVSEAVVAAELATKVAKTGLESEEEQHRRDLAESDEGKAMQEQIAESEKRKKASEAAIKTEEEEAALRFERTTPGIAVAADLAKSELTKKGAETDLKEREEQARLGALRANPALQKRIADAELKKKAAEADIKDAEEQQTRVAINSPEGKALQSRIAAAETRKKEAEGEVKKVEADALKDFAVGAGATVIADTAKHALGAKASETEVKTAEGQAQRGALRANPALQKRIADAELATKVAKGQLEEQEEEHLADALKAHPKWQRQIAKSARGKAKYKSVVEGEEGKAELEIDTEAKTAIDAVREKQELNNETLMTTEEVAHVEAKRIAEDNRNAALATIDERYNGANGKSGLIGDQTAILDNPNSTPEQRVNASNEIKRLEAERAKEIDNSQENKDFRDAERALNDYKNSEGYQNYVDSPVYKTNKARVDADNQKLEDELMGTPGVGDFMASQRAEEIKKRAEAAKISAQGAALGLGGQQAVLSMINAAEQGKTAAEAFVKELKEKDMAKQFAEAGQKMADILKGGAKALKEGMENARAGTLGSFVKSLANAQTLKVQEETTSLARRRAEDTATDAFVYKPRYGITSPSTAFSEYVKKQMDEFRKLERAEGMRKSTDIMAHLTEVQDRGEELTIDQQAQLAASTTFLTEEAWVDDKGEYISKMLHELQAGKITDDTERRKWQSMAKMFRKVGWVEDIKNDDGDVVEGGVDSVGNIHKDAKIRAVYDKHKDAAMIQNLAVSGLDSDLIVADQQIQKKKKKVIDDRDEAIKAAIERIKQEVSASDEFKNVARDVTNTVRQEAVQSIIEAQVEEAGKQAQTEGESQKLRPDQIKAKVKAAEDAARVKARSEKPTRPQNQIIEQMIQKAREEALEKEAEDKIKAEVETISKSHDTNYENIARTVLPTLEGNSIKNVDQLRARYAQNGDMMQYAARNWKKSAFDTGHVELGMNQDFDEDIGYIRFQDSDESMMKITADLVKIPPEQLWKYQYHSNGTLDYNTYILDDFDDRFQSLSIGKITRKIQAQRVNERARKGDFYIHKFAKAIVQKQKSERDGRTYNYGVWGGAEATKKLAADGAVTPEQQRNHMLAQGAIAKIMAGWRGFALESSVEHEHINENEALSGVVRWRIGDKNFDTIQDLARYLHERISGRVKDDQFMEEFKKAAISTRHKKDKILTELKKVMEEDAKSDFDRSSRGGRSDEDDTLMAA